MKRFHLHLAVADLPANIDFYTRLLGCPPARVESDYAKWMLDDPPVNLALSRRGARPGLDHLGIQVDTDAELETIQQHLAAAGLPTKPQGKAACCYAESDKYWTLDPQGIPWEHFHTLSNIPVFGEDTAIPVAEQPAESKAPCCSPTK